MFHSVFKTFRDIELEAKYNIRALQNVKQILYFSLLFFLINSILLILSDLYLLNYTLNLANPVTMSRIAFIVLLIFVLFTIKLTDNYNIVNIAILFVYLFISVSTFFAHYYNPVPEEMTYSIELCVIVTFYLVFPIDLKFRLIGSLIFTSSLWGSLQKGIMSDALFFQTILLIITANVTGFFIARYLNVTVRRLFLRAENMRIMRTEVEIASNDLKIIKGIIPICASCKKIRDDTGFWDQLESYFKRISNIDFVGEKCPNCLAKEKNEA